MLSGRMLKILEYIEMNPETSFKEISENLDINIRHIRYDLDKINDFLELENLPLIHKESKGVLLYPKGLDIQVFKEDESFIYTTQERMGLLLLMLLFDNKRLRLNQLSEDFQVSRSTLKNDLNNLKNELMKYNITIEYNTYYYISKYDKELFGVANKILAYYIEILYSNSVNYNNYHTYIKDILDKSFAPISISDILLWMRHLNEKYHYEFNDDEYKWYVSNILMLVYNLINNADLPDNVGFDAIYSFQQYREDIESFEQLTGHRLEHYYKGTFIRLLEYLDNNEGLSNKIDIIYIQSIADQLIDKMSQRLNIDFHQDQFLIGGDFLIHLSSLIKRVSTGTMFSYKTKTDIPKKNQSVFEVLKEVMSEIEILNQITDEDEIAHLAVYFIASIRRLKISFERCVLIVCYHGYGSATLLKDVLMNEYKVKVIDIIPSYKLHSYKDMENVDCIISTLPLKNTYGKDCVVVSPILTYLDHEHLSEIGIERKDNLINYYRLKEKLAFLSENDQSKVIKILQNELGQGEYYLQKSVYKVSDLLKPNAIKIINQDMNWKEAIIDSSDLLVQNGMVKEYYGEKIIQEIEKIGFYCVTDGYFALFHGKENADVYYSGMSLIVNKRCVSFDEKKVKIIFCLASKDKKDQIPAMMLLMRMVKKTGFLLALENAVSSKEVLEILLRCEKEVIS